jgi:hypothetical protein
VTEREPTPLRVMPHFECALGSATPHDGVVDRRPGAPALRAARVGAPPSPRGRIERVARAPARDAQSADAASHRSRMQHTS